MSTGLEAAFAAGDPRALAVARARAYALFARFVRAGVEPTTYEHAFGLDELRPHLSPWQAPDGGLAADLAAAEHQRVFGFEVPPIASLFVDPTGRAGGEVTERIQDALSAAGIPLDPTAEGADHLAVVLDALGFLSAAEAEAWADGAEARAIGVRDHARTLVAEVVLPWWAPFSEAVRRERSPFFAALVGAIEALVLDHAGDGCREDSTTVAEPPKSLLELLEDEHTGLRAIAEHLARPSSSGIYLSRGAIGRLGRDLGVPRGFGTRVDQLETLLGGAAESDTWPAAVDGLLAVVAAAADGYARAPRGEPFRRRTEATRAGLERLRDAPDAARSSEEG